MNIAGTTLSSKLLTHHKDHFVKLAVEAVLRLKGSGNLEAIHVIKKLGGSLADSYLDEGKSLYLGCWVCLRNEAVKSYTSIQICSRKHCYVIVKVINKYEGVL